MRIIVTTNKVDYPSMIKVSTLKDALSLVGSVEVLVIHTYPEQGSEAFELLKKLLERASKTVYVREERHMKAEVTVLVVTHGGVSVQDEVHLESQEDIDFLISQLGQDLTAPGSLDVLNNFLTKLVQEPEELNQNYAHVVQTATKDIIEAYSELQQSRRRIAEISKESLEESKELFNNLAAENEQLRGSIDQLEDIQAELDRLQNTRSFGSTQNISFFPKVNYLQERDIILIKELGSARYLTSFMLGYRDFLELEKNKRTRVVFIMPPGDLPQRLYENYFWLTKENQSSGALVQENIIFTNYPTKTILEKILDDAINYDCHIVVDRRSTTHEHVLKARNSKVTYAVGGATAVKVFKLAKKSFFSSVIAVEGALFTLSTVTEYPSDYQQRESLWRHSFRALYEILAMRA